MKYLKLNVFFCSLPILYFIYLWISYPEGVPSVYVIDGGLSKPNIIPIRKLLFSVSYSALLFFVLIFIHIKKFNFSTKRTQGEIWGYGLQGVIFLIIMYLAIHYNPNLLKNTAYLCFTSIFIIAGNYKQLTPFRDKESAHFSNKYEESNPVIWRKSFRLKGIFLILLGISYLINYILGAFYKDFDFSFYIIFSSFTILACLYIIPYFYSKHLYNKNIQNTSL